MDSLESEKSRDLQETAFGWFSLMNKEQQEDMKGIRLGVRISWIVSFKKEVIKLDKKEKTQIQRIAARQGRITKESMDKW